MQRNKLLLLLALLLTAATGAWAANTVTWTAQNQLPTLEGKTTATIDGVTITTPSGQITVNSYGRATFDGATFSVEDGNITKIVLKSVSGVSGYPAGWTISNNTEATWTGSAKSVSCGYSGGVYSIEFTIENVYTVTMAKGTVDATNWTINPAEAAEGTEVTLQYNGRLKVKGVKATSDAAAAGAKAAKDATAEDLGKVIGADGYIYDNVDAATAAGTTASAIIAYVGTAGSVDESSSTYKGLAIALTDANSGVTYQWCSEIGNTCVSQTDAIATAITYMDGIASTNTLTSDGHTHAAATAASSYGTDRPSGVSAWFLPSMGQWNLIVQGLATKQAGSTVSTDLTTSANNTYKSSNLNSVITDAGGTGFQSGGYWSSTEHTSGTAWRMIFSLGRAYNNSKTASNYVRAVFAF